ncbi:helix-turn-helix domain-containing protein [Candidatus Nanohaloarchaea archaeon]|nr:helix-turn-helix domain-containing protein [Candidatus Nanohaloarchaea archaeon]
MKNQLKEYRAEQDITQAQLAEQVNVSRQTINAIETGKYDPSLELALKIADFFDTEVERIFSLAQRTKD